MLLSAQKFTFNRTSWQPVESLRVVLTDIDWWQCVGMSACINSTAVVCKRVPPSHEPRCDKVVGHYQSFRWNNKTRSHPVLRPLGWDLKLKESIDKSQSAALCSRFKEPLLSGFTKEVRGKCNHVKQRSPTPGLRELRLWNLWSSGFVIFFYR